MRAYAACADQTRPTIVLHGSQLSIGPAGTDPHGPWGIHVAPLYEGRAQQLRDGLELAARRLAGSRGRPPRLLDEVPSFETKATNHWAPGVPPDLPPVAAHDLSLAARNLPSPARTQQASPMAAQRLGAAPQRMSATRPGYAQSARQPRRRSRSTGQLFGVHHAVPARRKTPPGPHVAVSSPRAAALAVVVTRTMPHGFQLTADERNVLNALGRTALMTAREIANVAHTDDGIAWMEALMTKLSECGLDIIALGPDRAGEPTYQLRR